MRRLRLQVKALAVGLSARHQFAAAIALAAGVFAPSRAFADSAIDRAAKPYFVLGGWGAALLFLGIGFFLLSKAIHYRRMAAALMQWPVVEGVVLATGVIKRTSKSDDEFDSYVPSVNYAYPVNGVRYEGDRIRIGLEAIALSIVSLGMVDAVAMLPLSISATATSSAGFRGPLLIVVAFGFGCFALLLASARLASLPLLRRSRRLHSISEQVSAQTAAGARRNVIIAGLYLCTCWTTRAVGSVLLLTALGFHFSPPTTLCVLCLSAAAGVIPITAGGAVANVGATAGILLALGVGRDIAINFSLASGLLLITSASAAAVAGLVVSIGTRALAHRRTAVLRA